MPHVTHRRTCPLCLACGESSAVCGADERDYFLCARCRLISADRRHHLSREDEAAHYRTHENSIHNEGYVKFLNRVIDPLAPFLKPGMRCLDFGCGPGPTLSQLVRRRGVECEDYDPIFRNAALSPPYDAVFATECLEHFCFPAQCLQRIAALLRPGGCLGIMTETWDDLDRFAKWYYTRDPTHVSFYHAKSIEFICAAYGFTPVYSDGRRVHVLRRVPLKIVTSGKGTPAGCTSPESRSGLTTSPGSPGLDPREAPVR